MEDAGDAALEHINAADHFGHDLRGDQADTSDEHYSASSCSPFRGTMKAASWNCRGLFASRLAPAGRHAEPA